MSNKEPGSLAGGTALVTAGSRGVGAATSKILAAHPLKEGYQSFVI
jgi:NAD(P)-dependent dehydrogenase (short-subunit alcohol dehydrogenase family)